MLEMGVRLYNDATRVIIYTANKTQCNRQPRGGAGF